MARPRAHSDDAILAAVRDLLLTEGPRGVTTAAVSARSGAPTGSLYHRFGSRDALVGELWVRTVRHFQDYLLAAAARAPHGPERPMAVASAVVDYALDHPEDARLLTLASRRELHAVTDLPASLVAALDELNRPAAALAAELSKDRYGDTSPDHLERVTLAVYGLPAAALRQRWEHGRDLAGLRELVVASCAAVLSADPG